MPTDLWKKLRARVEEAASREHGGAVVNVHVALALIDHIEELEEQLLAFAMVDALAMK